MKFSLAALLIVLFAVGASAICQNSPTNHLFQFVTRGAVCDGTSPTAPLNPSLPITDLDRGCTRCCKNFQSCMPNGTSFTCQEISQNMTCVIPEDDNDVAPCGPYLDCLEVTPTLSQCFFSGRLENGAKCTVSGQCASGLCGLNGNGTSNTCLVTKTAGNVGCRKQTDCASGLFCNITSGNCVKPLSANQDCSAAIGSDDDDNGYEALSSIPNYVCKSGNGCLMIPPSKAGNSPTYKCTPYYQASKKGTVCYDDQWWNCEFGFFCNLTSDKQGTCLITNQNGAIGDSCKAFPLSTSDQSECYWGTGCSCFTKNSTGNGQCQRMYNTNCQIQLNNLVNCIVNNNCPHDASQLVGGNGSPFASSTVVGSCIQTKCPSQHANLIKCQNDIGNNKAIYSSSYVPKTYPNNAYSDKENGLHGWEIGLIIVGVAVAIIIVVVIVVAVVRRKSSNGQYTPLE